MKTAATGDIMWIELPKNINVAKPSRLTLAVRSDKAASSVNVHLDLSDSGLLYLFDHVKTLCEKRAKEHEDIAARLRNPQ